MIRAFSVMQLLDLREGIPISEAVRSLFWFLGSWELIPFRYLKKAWSCTRFQLA
jgi:hypothetical protein